MKTQSERLRSASLHFDYDENEPKPEHDARPGKGSTYITRFDSIVHDAAERSIKRLEVVIYCRVSSDKQRRYGNLDHQLAKVKQCIRRLAAKYGVQIDVRGELAEDVSAWRLWPSARPELIKAAKLARKYKGVWSH